MQRTMTITPTTQTLLWIMALIFVLQIQTRFHSGVSHFGGTRNHVWSSSSASRRYRVCSEQSSCRRS